MVDILANFRQGYDENIISVMTQMDRGVSKGHILGSLMFILHIIYADDLALLISHAEKIFENCDDTLKTRVTWFHQLSLYLKKGWGS